MRVGLMGASCCGKSTLFQRLKGLYPTYCTLEEIASNFTDEQRKVFSFQREICKLQIAAEQDLSPKFISDRTVLDNLAYCLWYYKNYDYAEQEIYLDCVKIIDNHLKENPYDAIFFIDEYFDLVDNGIRTMDPVQQRETFDMLHGIAKTYGAAYNIPIYYIKGTTHDRINAVKRIIPTDQSI